MSRRTALALALGWFVVTDILLTTTSASAVNTLNSIGISFRGIVRNLISNYQVAYFGFTILILILICSILLIIFLLRAWLNTINLTRVLVSFFFLDEKNTSQDPSAREAFMLASLFGNNIMKSRNALVWQLLYSLLITWLLLLIITVLTGLISIVTTY